MHVDKLLIRQARSVPTDNGTQLADYVLQQMEELKVAEILKQKEEAK